MTSQKCPVHYNEPTIYDMSCPGCRKSTLIFGVDPQSLVDEWEEDLEPTYEKLKTLVQSSKISGTFYHEAKDCEEFEHLQVGDTIDYRSCLTRWRKDEPDDDGSLILKLTCEQVPGLQLRDEIILSECQLKVVSHSGNVIAVIL